MPEPITTSFETAKKLKRKSLENQGIITKVPTDIIFADEVSENEASQNEAETENNNNTEDKASQNKASQKNDEKEFTTEAKDNQIISDKDKRRLQMLKDCNSLTDNKAIEYIEFMKANRDKKYENLGNLSDEDIKKSADDIFNKLNKYDANTTKQLIEF